jgi:hypothetical protein
MKNEPRVQVVKQISSFIKERMIPSFFALKKVSSKNKLHNADESGTM